MTVATPLLVVEDLRTWLAGPAGTVRAVDGVSLALDAGRTLAIVGESGSGKTVLVRSIMGLLPRRHVVRATGRVFFDGREFSNSRGDGLERFWGREIAMIFQNPMTSLNPVMTVGAQIGEVLQLHLGVSRKEGRRRAVSLLASVGITDPDRRVDAYPHELSGGMRQRVLCAIALACGPKLLLADEPTTALDVTVQAQILALLAERQRADGTGIILVTHDLGVVASQADDVAVMYAGRIVERAPTSVLFAEARMPYTAGLMRSIPRLTDPSHTRLQVIPGRPPSLVDPSAGCPFAPRCPNVQPRCLEERPPLLAPGDPAHAFACWYPAGTLEGEKALKANCARGLVAALAAQEAVGSDGR